MATMAGGWLPWAVLITAQPILMDPGSMAMITGSSDDATQECKS